MKDPSEPLPVVRACELAPEEPDGPSWLVEGLWVHQGVGVIGGCPKLGKSWLALDIALSVASGTPCLGRFDVQRPGSVLLYAAEDGPAIVRSRLEGLCAHRRLPLASLPLYVITAESIRLDGSTDQRRLEQTVKTLCPSLLILDPFVRVYGRLDENSAGEVSALLAYLRCLQRTHGCAIILVHHVRKNGSVSSPGQALRGSGDIHAWGDVNLYMRRKGTELTLTIEHRCASSPDPMPLHLVDDDPGAVHLEGVLPQQEDTSAPLTPEQLEEKVLEIVAAAFPTPVTRAALRERLRTRNQRLGEVLQRLDDGGRLVRRPEGWTLPAPAQGPHTGGSGR